ENIIPSMRPKSAIGSVKQRGSSACGSGRCVSAATSRSAMLAATLSSCAGESTSPRDQKKPARRAGNLPARSSRPSPPTSPALRARAGAWSPPPVTPPADRRRSRPGPAAFLDDTELGGAAADVDVEDTLALIVRQLRRARAVGRQHRFHVVPGGGGDEIAAL